MSVLIKNGRVVTAVDDYYADIYIEGETIVRIGKDLEVARDTELPPPLGVEHAQPLDGRLVENVAEPGEHAAQAAHACAVLVQAVRHVFEHAGAGLVEAVRGTADDARDEVAG